jgi:hypothetical protein
VTDSARVPLLLGTVIGSLAVIVLAAGLLDALLRTTEVDRLLTAVEHSEATMYAFDDELTELFASYEGSFDALAEADAGGRTPDIDALFEAIDAEVARIAADHHTELAEARAAVHRIALVPWHTAVRSAKDDYLAHADAWLDYYADLAAEPVRLEEPRPEINATFFAAGAAMRRAVPSWADGELHRRVEAVFAVPLDDEDEVAAATG